MISFSISFSLLIGELGFLIALCIVGFLSGNIIRRIDIGILTAFLAVNISNILLILLIQAVDTELRTYLPFHSLNYVEFVIAVIIPSIILVCPFAALGASTSGQKFSRFVLRERSMKIIDYYCAFCGMYLSSSDKYCPNCGVSLLELEE